MRSSRTRPWLALLLLTAGACDRPPVRRDCDFDATVACPLQNDPAGRIEGTIVYEGPPPSPSATDPRVASGRIVLLLFDADDPPPPRGTASTAVSFQTLAASRFFAGAVALPGGRVRATAPFAFPGIPRAGAFELRAFYSRAETASYPAPDGTVATGPSGFDPLAGVRAQPVAGDVAGGALVDPTAAMPLFERIVVGTQAGTDGGAPYYTLPLEGAVTPGVTVFIGEPLSTDRPMFTVLTAATTLPGPMGPVSVPGPIALVADAVPALDAGATASPAALLAYARATGLLPAGSPVLHMPRNPVVQDTVGGTDLPSFSALASLPPSECAAAAIGGVLCPADPSASVGFFELAYDRDANGVLDFGPASGFGDAHPTLFTTSPAAAPVSGRLPWLFPLVVLARLHDPDAAESAALTSALGAGLPAAQLATLRAAFNRPETLDLRDPRDPRYPVLLFGTVVPGGDPRGFLALPWTTGYAQTEPVVRLAIAPVAIEVHGPNPATDWLAIVPPTTPAALPIEQTLLPPHYRCVAYDPAVAPDDPLTQAGLPTGRYAITLVDPTGQSWSVPNELASFPAPPGAPPSACPAGVCAAPSQALVVRIDGAVAPAAGVTVSCPSPPARM